MIGDDGREAAKLVTPRGPPQEVIERAGGGDGHQGPHTRGVLPARLRDLQVSSFARAPELIVDPTSRWRGPRDGHRFD